MTTAHLAAVPPGQPVALVSHRDWEAPDRPGWLIEGLVRNTITLITGLPNVGKTNLAMHLVRSLIEGEGTPVLSRVPAGRKRVCWWGDDAGWDEEFNENAAEFFGWDDANRQDGLFFFNGRMSTYQNREPWPEFTARLVADGIEVLVVDNLFSLLGEANANGAGEVNPVLDELKQVARLGISVIVLHHASKGVNNSNLKGLGSGNVVIDGFARHQIAVGVTHVNDLDSPRRLLTINGNRIKASWKVFLTPWSLEFRAGETGETEQEDSHHTGAATLLGNAPEEILTGTQRAIGKWMADSDLFPTIHTESGGTTALKRWKNDGLVAVAPGTDRYGPGKDLPPGLLR